MNDTGRIRKPLDWRMRRILFGNNDDKAIREELRCYADIDKAHIVMLVERGLLAGSFASPLLAAIDSLLRHDFAPLCEGAAPRGLYLCYEDWLIHRLGEQAGGAAHLARSRNDINATVVRLRLRPVYYRLSSELLRLLAVLIRRAQRYAAMTMPVYTHYQPALPITYGHYLAGVATALARDLDGIHAAADDLDRAPLGAGAAGGTEIPIDRQRTARLLGFREPALHSVDAVASRDVVLRVLAAASVLGVTLSRLATDLQLWSTAEFDCVRFPDELVGSSSMMPQKRNVFVLEHVQGRAGAPLGAFTAAAVAMHATPFTNSVATGTESVKPVWQALTAVTEAIVLIRIAVRAAEPQPDRMERRATEGFTTATALANGLVLDSPLSFRQAHYKVGKIVTAAVESGQSLETTARMWLSDEGLLTDPMRLDPAAVAAASSYGGGPSRTSMAHILEELRRQWRDAACKLAERARRWRAAADLLDAAAHAVNRKDGSHA